MAERQTQFAPQARAGQTVNVNFDTGAARALNQTAVTLANVANTLAGEADRRASIQATREGTQAGAFGVPNLRDEYTISGEAFNRAAIQSYTNRLELQSRNALARIQTENAADPAGFQAASMAYMRGVSEEIQGVAPWLVPTFQQRYQLQEQQQLQHVTAQYANIQRDGARADVYELSRVIRDDMEENASGLFSDSLEESTLAMGSMLQDMQRIDGMMNQIGANGMPLFSELERVKQMEQLRDHMYTSAVRGLIRRDGSSFELIQNLMDGRLEFNIQAFDESGEAIEGESTAVNLRAELSDDAYEGLISFAKQQLVFENQVAAQREAEYQSILEAEQEAIALNMWARIEGRVDPETGEPVQPLSVTEVYQAADSGMITSDDAITMIRAIEVPGVDVSDPGVMNRLRNEMYLNGNDISSAIRAEAPLLTTRDQIALQDENRELQSGTPNMVTSQRQMLAQFYSPGSTLAGPTDQPAVARQSQALTEYDLRVREGEDPIQVRLDLQSRSQAFNISGPTAELVRPRYFVPGAAPNTIDVQASTRALAEARANGNVSDESFVRQMSRIQQWQNAQAHMPIGQEAN